MSNIDQRLFDLGEVRAYLAKAKAAQRLLPERYPADFDWAMDVLEDAHSEIERLRGLLRELEWAGGMCPICHVLPNPDRLLGARSFHDPDCWLAVEVRLT